MAILDQFGRPIKGRTAAKDRRPPLRASYDSYQFEPIDENHWLAADGRSPLSANTAEIRERIRNRARYERDNSPTVGAIIETRTNDIIGTGPRLQLNIPGASREVCRSIERKYAAWTRDPNVKYSEQLRVMIDSESVAGDCFGVFKRNFGVKSKVQFSVQLVEPEVCSTPDLTEETQHACDGIVFDEWGNPKEYHFLKSHPGDNNPFGTLEYDRVPARFVVHWFKPIRPGQRRGVSRIQAGLPNCAATRRYSRATLISAEVSSRLTGVIETDWPEGCEPPATEEDEYEEVEIALGHFTTLPRGAKLNMAQPTQPSATHVDFVKSQRAEMGRTLNAPENISIGSSKEYNYSSGKLDHLPYQTSVKVERHRLRLYVLDHVFLFWLELAGEIPNYLPKDLPDLDEWSWEWQYDGFGSAEPLKDVNASSMRIEKGLSTLAAELAEDGKDWEEVLEQRAKEQAYKEKLGLVAPKPEAATESTEQPSPSTSSDLVLEGDQSEEDTVLEDKESGGEPAKSKSTKQAAASGDIQGTALNGAQVTSLVAITDKVSAKLYPADGAKKLIQSAFPLMPSDLINQFVDAISKHEPPPQSTAEPAKADQTEEVEEEEEANV